MALVGFFDILGTREAVLQDRFSDLTALDFAGPVGLAAELIPSMRFAVFSDCVVASAEMGDERNFLRAVALMYGQWFADFVLVRGGVAEGEIRWVDYEAVDKHFRKCKNLACARVYGKGLVLAHELEQRSGPGAITYLTEQASAVLSTHEPNSVLTGIAPALCWASEREANTLLGYSAVNIKHEPNEGAARRHAIATEAYWRQVITQRKYLPAAYQVLPCV